jgi:hypothetical protein
VKVFPGSRSRWPSPQHFNTPLRHPHGQVCQFSFLPWFSVAK